VAEKEHRQKLINSQFIGLTTSRFTVSCRPVISTTYGRWERTRWWWWWWIHI